MYVSFFIIIIKSINPKCTSPISVFIKLLATKYYVLQYYITNNTDVRNVQPLKCANCLHRPSKNKQNT